MTMIKYTFDKVDHHIALVAKDGVKLQNKIHALAITILSHWALNEGAGPLCAEKINALQVASPYHQKAFADWVGLKTGLQWSKEGQKWFAHVDQKMKQDRLDAAKAEPFWEVSPAKEPTPFTDEAVVEILQKILAKQVSRAKRPVEGDAFTTRGNEAIRSAIAALSAPLAS